MSTAKEILKKYWGHDNFRPLQEDIINSALAGNDTLALLPTGGGKSICFQVPGLCMEGLTLVISPLIALMKDQVENLKKRGIKSVAIFSGMSAREIDISLDNCIYGNYKFLYVSPERLHGSLFKERLKKMPISLIAVDEAHCISQWGYDFRPSYLKIAELREIFPKVPILALTATATLEVEKDIQEKLSLKNTNIFKKSFFRENLSYVVFHEEMKDQKLLDILKKVNGSSIVYVRNRKKTREIAQELNRNKISSCFYHAGLLQEERAQTQDQWIKNQKRVMVATNAFGMGIDKPDVRLVVHTDLPESPEAFFQESGRAGRDGNRAFGVLLFSNTDLLSFEEKIEKNFPDIEFIKSVYQALSNYFQLAIGSGENTSFPLNISELCSTFNLEPTSTFSALKILEMEGLINFSESSGLPSRVKILMDTEELYILQVKNKRLDALIKLLLRSYEGMFDDFVPVNEFELAKRAQVPVEKLIEQLNYLHRNLVLEYLPKSDLPVISYPIERQDASRIKISPENLKERKKRAIEKFQALKSFILEKKDCRNKILLRYFGEDMQDDCGICDICIEKKKANNLEQSFLEIKQKIKEHLDNQSSTSKELVSIIGSQKETEIIKAIQWLLDNGELTVESTTKLKLTNRGL